MSDEGNNQLNKQSKFRFLNPDEKKKLKELNEEILGENKNITFDSNVDLTVQFEKKGYDTQRYNIKKLVNERLDATQVYDVSRVLEREKNESQVVEPDAPSMIVTEIYRNDKNSENEQQVINENTNKATVENNSEEKVSESESNDFRGILKNTTDLTRKGDKVEHTENQTENQTENNSTELEKTKPDTQTSSTTEVPPRMYPYNDNKKKIELPEEKREQAKELFLNEDTEDESSSNYTEFKDKAVKIGFYLILVLMLIIIILLAKGLFEKLNTGSDKADDNITDITGEIIDSNDSTDGTGTEEVATVDDVEPPIDKEVMSTYNAVVEIVHNNTSNVVLEITNDDFQYVKASNDTDFFNDYVYANIKNAQPEKKEDNLVVLFGKDDNRHFGTLRYLDDADFFNSILVDYTKNNITTRYKALSYYKTSTLDDRLYAEMSDSDLVKFITEEVNKSLHTIRKDFTVENDSKILTLVTFDSNENIYYCLHLINVE